MSRRLRWIGVLFAATLAVSSCSQSYSECSRDYRADYRSKHGVSPTQTQVNNACRDRTGTRGYYGSGSRGSKHGGSYSSGGK